jgi:hypothetical protein
MPLTLSHYHTMSHYVTLISHCLSHTVTVPPAPQADLLARVIGQQDIERFTRELDAEAAGAGAAGPAPSSSSVNPPVTSSSGGGSGHGASNVNVLYEQGCSLVP